MTAPDVPVSPEELPEAFVRVAAGGRIAVCNERARQLLAGCGEVGPGVDWFQLLVADEDVRFGRLIGGLAVGATARQEFHFGPRSSPVRLAVNALRLAAGFACSLQRAEGMRAGPPIFVGQTEVWLPPNFLSRLTHQLKNHVATAQAASFLLRTRGRAPEDAREKKWAGAIQESVVSLGTILEQMDALERTVTGAPLQAPEPLNLPDWIQMVADRSRKAAPASTVSLVVKPGASGRWWFGEVFLGTALECLLLNALHFAPAGGAASVQAIEDGLFLEFTVADNGPGVTPAEVERLFTPFFRGQNAQGVTGSGLGLAIARAAVTRLGGTVKYVRRPGIGTEVQVRVPARPER
jgi:signal transduction histidine kinase